LKDAFWTLYELYHKARRGSNFRIDGGWNGGGNSSGE
jgi:hypothetical protein